MRSDNVIKSSFWKIFNNMLSILLGFGSRTIFIHFLSADYLGINGLFTNVLSLLSLAELGFSTAVTFNLYKPLIQKDEKKIAGIMNLYKWVYRVVAVFIAIAGLCVVPFLGYICKDSQFELNYLRITYLLFLGKTVSTYFFSYNSTLITADQKEYKILPITSASTIVCNVFKILTLVVTRNFLVYLATDILVGILFNAMTAYYVKKEYPLLRDKDTKLDKDERKKIFSDVGNLFLGKLSTTILTSTDNIIISSFVNVVSVGLMSNYTTLIGYVQTFINAPLYSAQASIGNAVAAEPKEYVYKILKRLTMMTFFVASFSATALLCLSNDFIAIIWDNLILPMPVVVILMVNSFLQMIKQPLWITLNTCGLFKKDKYISLAGALCNLIVSLVLVQFWDISGVIWGTIISQLLQMILKARLLFKDYFQESCVKYLLLICGCFAGLGIEMGVTYFLCSLVPGWHLYLVFVVKAIICTVVPTAMIVLTFRKTDAFDYTLGLIKHKLLKK